MNLKTKLFLAVVLLLNIPLFAQDTFTLSGTVRSAADNTVLPGVSVLIVNTTDGVTTDFDGNFEIDVKVGDQLKISYLGYVSQTVDIQSQSPLEIAMVEDMNQLDEVVVIGYGTQKKSSVTGAVAQIDGDNIASVQATRVDQALTGKLAGVLVQNQDGAPGADPKIQIRAASSISSDVSPLIVVDGYPISGSLATVNPNDIESLEVLKDAASAAIFGSRGANGVILVTTKKGRTGKASFTYDGYISSSSNYFDNILSSGPEWAAHARREIEAGNWTSTVNLVDPEFLEYRLNAYENSPGAISTEDWLFRTGFSQRHNFSVSGGGENANYFASVGYQDDEGVVLDQNYERVNVRLNVDAKVGKFAYGLSFNGFAAERGNFGPDMRDVLRAYGVHPIYHTEESIAFVQSLDQQAQALGLAAFDNGYRGSTYEASSIYDLVPGMAVNDWHYGRANNGIGGSGDAGPAAKLDNWKNKDKQYFGNASAYFQYSFIEGLDLKTVLGGDYNDTHNHEYRLLGFDSRARDSQTFRDQTDLTTTSVVSVTTLSYNKTFAEKHDVSALVGYEFQRTRFRGTSLDGSNVPDEDFLNWNLFNPADIAVSERKETQERESIFGRLSYAYDNRYLVTFSIRRDGDSRFGENNKYETFPALSLGWNVHNEAFMKDADVLSRLKVRFSTGSLGTTSFLGSYDALSLLDPSATIYGTGYLIPENVANPDLTWQTNTETNYGVDLGFLNNRYSLSVDYYTSDIEDILINQSVSEVLGTTSIVLNSGDVRSSGWEFEFGGRVFDDGDFTWSFTGNLSTVTTEITDLGGLDELPRAIYGVSGRGPVFRNYVGGQIGEMWGLETIGDVEMDYIADGTRHPDNATGESYVVDQNGDGIIDRTRTVEEGGDLVLIGQNTPNMYWGITNNFSYKNFDLSFQFQGAHGGEVYNIDPHYYGSEFGGRLDYARLDPDGDGIADHNGQFYERNRNQTDAYIQDASYVSLRNFALGYTFRTGWIERSGINSIRAYGAATNLLYFTASDYTSYNPEGVRTSGSDYLGPTTYGAQVGASPIVRAFTLGLTVKF
jgi:TonB-linked SusC/RagA family outer membrane protein